MTAVDKNVYFDVLNDIVAEYSNTNHRTIKTKPIDVGNDFFAEYNEESNEKDRKFKIGDHVRNIVPWTYEISDLNGDKIVGSFYEKELQRTNQREFRIEKVIKRKGNKLYVKWKGYNNSFNIWIDKKDLINK